MGKDGSTGKGINTRLTHTGHKPSDFFGFVNPPVAHGSTILFPDSATMVSGAQKYTYGTRGTPTTDALAAAIDELEGSAGTIIVPSGLAAIVVPLLSFLKSGDHLLLVDTIYFPTRRLANTLLAGFGVEVEYYDPLIGAGISALMKPNTKVVFTESPGSNTYEVQDIPAIAKAAHAGGAIVMMDNTWATPLLFNLLTTVLTFPFTPRPNIRPDIPISCSARCRRPASASINSIRHSLRSESARDQMMSTRCCVDCARWASG